MNTLKEIQEFLQPKKLAIAGASRNPKKFGGTILRELKNKGFELFPVHPEAKEIEGIPCFSSVSELPEGIDHLYIVTRKSQTAGIVGEALKHGIRKIWIQQHSDTPEALEMAKKQNVPVISGRCMLMFANPVTSVHSFHRWFSRLFGAYPR
jgi:uncharacterized protein